MATDAHPYSAARSWSGLVFASGALPTGADGEIVGGRREALDAAMETLKSRLATAGADISQVLKITYYVTDITLRDEANQQCIEVFDEPRPARSCVGVESLPYGAVVEIEAIAGIGGETTPSVASGFGI